MTEDFLKNAVSHIGEIETLEAIEKMTRSFNIKDFYDDDFEGKAQMMITPDRVIIVYSKGNNMFHNSAISYLRDNIIDLKTEKPIITIRCQSDREIKAFVPEILGRGYPVTQNMISVLEILYAQIRDCNDTGVLGETLQEFKKSNGISSIVDKKKVRESNTEKKNMIGIEIEEYIRLKKEPLREQEDLERE